MRSLFDDGSVKIQALALLHTGLNQTLVERMHVGSAIENVAKKKAEKVTRSKSAKRRAKRAKAKVKKQAKKAKAKKSS